MGNFRLEMVEKIVEKCQINSRLSHIMSIKDYVDDVNVCYRYILQNSAYFILLLSRMEGNIEKSVIVLYKCITMPVPAWRIPV